MRFACITGILLCFAIALHAQDITGIWRGYFFSGYGLFKQEYKYEIQINQLNGRPGPGNAKAIKGVTYSYRLTSFYGKARFVGIYNNQTREITLKEDTLEEVKLDAPGFSCLMTCYLEYHKMGNQEVLEGTFSSIVTNKGTDCGNGSVYLERVEESDFHKEAFLLKKKPAPENTRPLVKKPEKTSPKADSPLVIKKPAPPAPKNNGQPVVTQTIPKKHIPAKQNIAKAQADSRSLHNTADSSLVRTAPVAPVITAPPPSENLLKKQMPPVPDIIKQRDNPLVKTIVTNSTDIRIELYDNGEIDGDTITVYHNNEVVAFKRGLTNKAITINIKASLDDPHHEFVMVADNLGSIPPNTALMVVTTGGKRYEVFISSDEKKNAKVVIDYKLPASNTR